ncbi:DUF3500 domain-containing protein [Deinococcus misasensis]|uniref:DUF3500 domain-containing protein n=1 Tax=Deinococcus misasensis TaxID=392413 RepID=UPI000552F27C|nr:DUF3500 domain-containing protein [Deinococcus misasensis]
MRKNTWILSGLLAFSLLGAVSLSNLNSAQAATTTTTTIKSDQQTDKVVKAANAFLATLSGTQKSKVLFAWDNATQRKQWSNFPTGIFQRNGIKWGDLSEAQRTALMNLLGSVLSEQGLTMVKQQMQADEVLKSTDGGGRLVFGDAEYYVSFVGTPSSTSPWTLQFGGHHLALNATVVGSNITLAPSLTGGQPVRYTSNGQKVEVVGQEVKDAFAMVNGLSSSQKAKAVISTRSMDLVLGPGQDGKTLQPEGLKGSELTDAQKTQFLALIQDRLGALNANDLAEKMTTIKANLNNTYFAWYGPTTSGSAAYYRVTGPTVVIEFSPQSMGGDATNHIHSMYRDPTNDYGSNWTK